MSDIHLCRNLQKKLILHAIDSVNPSAKEAVIIYCETEKESRLSRLSLNLLPFSSFCLYLWKNDVVNFPVGVTPVTPPLVFVALDF